MIKAKPENVKRARILKGLTQTQLAKTVKLNPASICLIENGELGARPRTAKAICEALESEFDELFEIVSARKEA
ncbi:MAG: helix-turn-helix transcriptional regulator [Bacillota bacterium]